jgi:hypothetical protein
VFDAYFSDAVQAEDPKGEGWKLYVIRNGPTRIAPDAEIDHNPRPDLTALRAYRIIVNESEVMSIAALRLSRPTGAIDFTTANGFASKCSKQTDQPFEQSFMKCLVELGEARASSPEGPWRPLGMPRR